MSTDNDDNSAMSPSTSSRGKASVVSPDDTASSTHKHTLVAACQAACVVGMSMAIFCTSFIVSAAYTLLWETRPAAQRMAGRVHEAVDAGVQWLMFHLTGVTARGDGMAPTPSESSNTASSFYDRLFDMIVRRPCAFWWHCLMSGVDVISTGISFASGIVASIYERFVSRPYTSVMNGVLRDYRLVDIVTSFAAMLVVVGMVMLRFALVAAMHVWSIVTGSASSSSTTTTAATSPKKMDSRSSAFVHPSWAEQSVEGDNDVDDQRHVDDALPPYPDRVTSPTFEERFRDLSQPPMSPPSSSTYASAASTLKHRRDSHTEAASASHVNAPSSSSSSSSSSPMFGIDVLNAAAKKMRRDGGGDATAAMTMKGSSIRNKRVHHATSAKHGSVLDMKFDIPAELMRGAVGGSSEE